MLLAGFFCAVGFGLVMTLPGCKPEELGAAHHTTPDYYEDPEVLVPEPRLPPAPKTQSEAEVRAKSEGCMSCHVGIENPSMHESKAVKIGCTDCHGGNALATTMEAAHVHPHGHWYHAPQEDKPETRVVEKKDTEEKKEEEKKTSSLKLDAGMMAQFLEVTPAQPVSARPQEPIVETKDEHKKEEKKGDGHDHGKDAKKDPHAGHAHAASAHGSTHGAHGKVQSQGGHGALGYGNGNGHNGSANPKRSYAAWQMESAEFVRFVNPGDLRVSKYTCGECHPAQIKNVPLSMMASGAMLWGAALYNNGSHNSKRARFGEAYTFDGKPARMRTIPAPTEEETRTRGVLPFLDPLPRYNVTQMGNILRAFERGGEIKIETSQQDILNEPGKPEFKQSIRGVGTLLATDPVFLGLQKTRLLDPLLWQMGTNDQAGDYRSSGCTACHTPYANDRDPAHSGPWAQYGKHGQSFTEDKALAGIRGKQPGHPIKHLVTNKISSAQCVVCHMHPGTTVTNTYYGTQWWDNETHGDMMYPKTQLPKKTAAEEFMIRVRNPEGSALRGLWGDVNFLESLYDTHNAKFTLMQINDFHGHGWVFRNVYKKDLFGNLLDKDDKIVPHDSPNKFKKGANGEPIAGSAVHMQDIHMEKGMHCIDCHFDGDNHGNGKLYGEVRNATEIMCADCHGTIYDYAKLVTTGNAAPDKGTDLSKGMTAFGKRFKKDGGKIIQQSALTKGLTWEVRQTKDTVNPTSPFYNEASRLAKTIRKDGKTWGDLPEKPEDLAHQDSKMDCYVCHTSFVASCFGCHLPMRANEAAFNQHFEGAKSRNWTQYNFQTLRDDIFFLGLDGTVKKNKVAPVRSMCAVMVGSQNSQREWIYSQQQTISAEGFSGQAFAPHFPHSVRSKETKNCTDCHVSAAGDNNSWLTQVYMLGTNQTNFMYRYVYTADRKGGLHATIVTEQSEPQAVIGSTLHRDAYPEDYAKHLAEDKELDVSHGHKSHDVHQLQLRGEYLYAALGKGGMYCYDVFSIDNKGFSEKIITAPVSPLGQKLGVDSEDCRAVISPTVLGVDPTRQAPFMPRNPANEEQGIAPLYAFLYCLDHKEGLFTVNAWTLLDGNPTNNYLHRHMTFNPGGILNGAVNGLVAGNYLYVCADAGLVVIDISGIGAELVEAAQKLNPDGKKRLQLKELEAVARPANPTDLKVVAVIPMNKPKAVRIQFRYAYVVDADGLKVVDITVPEKAKKVEKALVPFKDARNVYLSRAYALVSAGSEGVAFVDIMKAEEPKIEQVYNAGGKLNDVNDIKVGMTNASVYGYVANGKGGLAVLQLTAPEKTPGYLGWAARYSPELISWKKLGGNTVNISEGLQRDRGVDESGNQLSVFNRVGSRPFNKTELQRMYLRNGEVWTVTNKAPGAALEWKVSAKEQLDAMNADLEKKEEEVKKERNPAKKKKLQGELDEMIKKRDEFKNSSGAGKEDRIKELEEGVKKERNPAKKKKLQEELDALKK